MSRPHGNSFRALGFIAILFAWTACDQAAELACDEGDLELSSTFLERWDPPTACASHEDCVLLRPDVRCPADGGQYTWCERAVHREDVAAFEATLAGVLTDVCPRTPDCVGSALCSPTVARCQEDRCVAVEASAACVDHCAGCLTPSSCEGHCGSAHLDCILAADGCDAINACVSGPVPPDGG